jgi:hypothetical protein
MVVQADKQVLVGPVVVLLVVQQAAQLVVAQVVVLEDCSKQ